MLLTLLDKAVLGSVVVGVGFLANRALESRKSKQAVRATLAEERMPRIAKAVATFTDLRNATRRLANTLLHEALIRTHLTKTFFGGAPSEEELTVIEKAFEEVRDERISEVDDVDTRISNALQELADEHFWIGHELHDALWWEYQQLSAILVIPQSTTRTTLADLKKRPTFSIPVIGSLRRRLHLARHNRRLARLGLEPGGVTADVDRMATHVTRG
jgi:hypothetical protein